MPTGLTHLPGLTVKGGRDTRIFVSVAPGPARKPPAANTTFTPDSSRRNETSATQQPGRLAAAPLDAKASGKATNDGESPAVLEDKGACARVRSLLTQRARERDEQHPRRAAAVPDVHTHLTNGARPMQDDPTSRMATAQRQALRLAASCLQPPSPDGERDQLQLLTVISRHVEHGDAELLGLLLGAVLDAFTTAAERIPPRHRAAIARAFTAQAGGL